MFVLDTCGVGCNIISRYKLDNTFPVCSLMSYSNVLDRYFILNIFVVMELVICLCLYVPFYNI